MHHIFQLGTKAGFLPMNQMSQKIGRFAGLEFQYYQIRNLVRQLQSRCNVFRPLTQLDLYLKADGQRQLSKVYTILASLVNVTDVVKWETYIKKDISESN